jgi:hypothetical protein
MKLRNPIPFVALFILLVGLACSAVTGGNGGGGDGGGIVPQPSSTSTDVPTPVILPTVTPVSFDPLTGAGDTARSLLTYDDLMTGSSTAPVNDSAFALPPEAAPPAHTFQGKLDLTGEAKGGGFQLLRDDFGYSTDTKWQHLPEMSFEFVQSGSHFIPVDQGLVYTGHAHWNSMVAPGRVWQETGDQGFSRASFPFALIERNQNCVHNGVMTFLFDDTTVSNVRYQITQETCMYHKFDMWGQLKATYSPATINNAEVLIAAHFDWLSHLLPTKPLSALNEDYPDAKINEGFIPVGVSPEHITTYGVFYNGVNYVSRCNTRYGEYAYCFEMRLPSYSTAKSALAGVAYMRLGQLYDPNLGNLLIKDYFPQAGSDWDGVTLNHALDMSTGHYARPAYMFDEYYGVISSKYIVDESYSKKLADALSFPRSGAPGQLWVYHSTDTFLAAQTMQEYLRKQGGGDLFDLLVSDIFVPLHFSTGSLSIVRTDNSPTGRTFGSHGMFYTPDDIAKLASFLTVGAGAIDNEQILHPSLLADTMQRNPADRGIRTTEYNFLYNNSFWAKEYYAPCNFTVVFMSGYGGISVAMLPNGATYYIFSDNGEFLFDSAVTEVGKLGEVCER